MASALVKTGAEGQLAHKGPGQFPAGLDAPPEVLLPLQPVCPVSYLPYPSWCKQSSRQTCTYSHVYADYQLSSLLVTDASKWKDKSNTASRPPLLVLLNYVWQVTNVIKTETLEDLMHCYSIAIWHVIVIVILCYNDMLALQAHAASEVGLGIFAHGDQPHLNVAAS